MQYCHTGRDRLLGTPPEGGRFDNSYGRMFIQPEQRLSNALHPKR